MVSCTPRATRVLSNGQADHTRRGLLRSRSSALRYSLKFRPAALTRGRRRRFCRRLNTMSDLLTIGKLAAAANVNVETIRFYQRKGLLPEPPRPPGGVRRYPRSLVSRIGFIKRAKLVGFTLREIGELLTLGDGHCRQVQQMTELKLASIEAKLTDLAVMRDALSELLVQCRKQGDSAHCTLVERLAGDPAAGE